MKRNPRANDPEMFTTNVPIGNDAVVPFTMKPSTPYRATAPVLQRSLSRQVFASADLLPVGRSHQPEMAIQAGSIA